MRKMGRGSKGEENHLSFTKKIRIALGKEGAKMLRSQNRKA